MYIFHFYICTFFVSFHGLVDSVLWTTLLRWFDIYWAEESGVQQRLRVVLYLEKKKVSL